MIKLAILRNESETDYLLWVKACQEYPEKIDFQIINLTADDWLKKIKEQVFDILLLRPPGQTSLFKQLYDERTYILSEVLKKRVYPSFPEVLIYENKRLLSYWLTALDIPAPETKVFYYKQEALNFAAIARFPIVLKTNIGASGKGVQFIKSKLDLVQYINQAFSLKGIQSFKGPKLFKGNILVKIKKVMTIKGFVKNRLKEYKDLRSEINIGFVLVQEFVPHEFEWRCVRIGNSFFTHKKILKGDKASGTLKKEYGAPPKELLNFVHMITEQNNLFSVSIDLFQQGNKFFVNEIQCFFGQSDPHQMIINGQPGRYIINNKEWVFEAGVFNQNESYNLRLQSALQQLKEMN